MTRRRAPESIVGGLMRGPIAVLLVSSLALPLGCASNTAADPKPPDPVGAPPPQTKSDPAPAPQGGGVSGRDRTDAAVESMIVGAMVGAIFGPIGAAAGALGLGVYGAVTGDVPLSGGRSGGGRRGEAEAEDEMEP